MATAIDQEAFDHRYIVGIDLGTTNTAMAYVRLDAAESRERRIRRFAVPQLVGPGAFGERRVLPSFLYLPGRYELPDGSTALPWDPERPYAVGVLARDQGALVPGRLVSSAKSWLVHRAVDRQAPILPWGADEEVGKVSPVAASARYLQHLREAWDAAMAADREEDRLREQLVVLTVPASFDEVARELTVEAAKAAGLGRIVLLEEPLAAFYAWLSSEETGWRQRMGAGQLVLVCDVGGGTTDFTLIAIREGEKGLRFDRLAVGEHLMLGGDNMDLALARKVEMELLGAPGKLDSRRWHQLAHQCRQAKESLLGPGDAGDGVDVTVMGSGGRLIADTRKTTLRREAVQALILDGFFAEVPLAADEKAAPGRKGLTEWGLPYEPDPVVTRHMARFWLRHRSLVRQETGRDDLFPDFLLFNGGALIPPSVRERLLDVAGKWFAPWAGEGWRPAEIPNPEPELSVAAGAAYYGLVRMGQGVRVGAGSPRTYYVEVAAEGVEPAPDPGKEEAEDGAEAPVETRTGVCLVPRGTEEGYETTLSEPSFQVIANRPVAFQLFTSHTRLGDRLGDLLALPTDEISVLPPIRTVLRFGKKGSEQVLPVELAVRLSEVGTLDLWCRSQQTPHRWQLRFDVRQDAQAGGDAGGETLDDAVIGQALDRIASVFGPENRSGRTPPDPIVKALAGDLGLEKEAWPTALLRKMADRLIELRDGRSISPHHEARWLNLLGYCMRPGFGDPLDEWRMKEVWKTHLQGLVFDKKQQGRVEWWILWRRVAGGLTVGQQRHAFSQMAPALLKPAKARKAARRMTPQEEREVWMAAASFERLPVSAKVDLGRAQLERVASARPAPTDYWTLGRLGARVPFYGPLDRVVPAAEAGAWLQRLLDAGTPPGDAAAQAMVQMARRTGDRERDLSEEDRNRLDAWLSGLANAERYRERLHRPEQADSLQEQEGIFGEALPPGFVLQREE